MIKPSHRYCLMSGSIKLQRRQATVHIWFMVLFKFVGISVFKTLNFLMRAIIHYTWILTEAIVWLNTTSSLSSCSLPSRNAGIFNSTPSESSNSWMVNPLSVIIESPFSQSCGCSIPHPETISLSDSDPGYNRLTKVMAPSGLMPTKALYVTWCL